jgi:hypothetical protein
MATHLGYGVFVSEPIPQNVTELVPNGDRLCRRRYRTR